MNTFFLVILLAAAAGWVIFGLARLQALWEVRERQTTDKRRTFTSAGLTLMKNLEHVQKLDEEIKRLKDKMETAVREQRDKHESLRKNAPPPPPDIYATSEYPPSEKETAWMATFVRDPRVPPQPNEQEPKPMLIWGHNQGSAIARARQLIQENKAYTVGTVGPFSNF